MELKQKKYNTDNLRLERMSKKSKDKKEFTERLCRYILKRWAIKIKNILVMNVQKDIIVH